MRRDGHASQKQIEEEVVSMGRIESWITLLETCVGKIEDVEEGKVDLLKGEEKMGAMIIHFVQKWEQRGDSDEEKSGDDIDPSDLKGVRREMAKLITLYQTEISDLREENTVLWRILDNSII